MQKSTKKKALKIALAIIAIIIITLLVITPFVLDKKNQESENKASILSGTVTTGSISSTVSGTGTLTDQSALEVSVPYGVEITQFLVSNGDQVEQGQLLANVNRTSVMQAISQVEETLEYLEEEMSSVQGESSSSTVKAPSSGRIKAVYCEAGDDVKTVMREHGALALLSLDGFMAVEFDSYSAVAGQAVKVAFSDGSTAAAIVESVRLGRAVVITSDDGPALGEHVSVVNDDGDVIGEGDLYIHNEWKAVAYSGSVSRVYTSENKKVYSGSYLFSLSGSTASAEFDSLAEQHREYEQIMQELFIMYQDKGICSPGNGFVSGIDESIATEMSAEGEYHISLLASNTPNGMDDISYTNQVGMVTAVSESGLTVKFGSIYSIDDYSDLSMVNTAEDAMTMFEATVTPPMSIFCWNPNANEGKGGWDQKSVEVGDVYLFTYDNSGFAWMIFAGHNEYTSPETPTPDDDSGGGTGGGTGGFISGSLQEDSFSMYSTDETYVLSVVPTETMSVTMTVDELDILSVGVGSDALITIDALPGKSFSGSVSSVDTTASNSGGNTKYTATVTLERGDNMLAGMNASILIVSGCVEDVAVIPVEALCELKNETVVYTRYDEESKELLEPVGVTTGLSDGINVEIISGLEIGDSYVYSYYDTLEVYQMFKTR